MDLDRGVAVQDSPDQVPHCCQREGFNGEIYLDSFIDKSLHINNLQWLGREDNVDLLFGGYSVDNVVFTGLLTHALDEAPPRGLV